MTTEQTTDPTFEVVATEGSRLEHLQAIYPAAKAAADEAAAQLKAVTDGIKFELNQAAPEAHKLRLVGTGDAPGLELSYVERWTIDSRKLKADDPETYVRYARKGGSWTLRQAKSLPEGGQS